MPCKDFIFRSNYSGGDCYFSGTCSLRGVSLEHLKFNFEQYFDRIDDFEQLHLLQDALSLGGKRGFTW